MKKWTKKEDSLLIREIKAHPENLSKCFLKVGAKINRTQAACMYRWYNYTSKQYSKNVNAACFAIFSKNKYSVNRKNLKENTPAKKKTIWQKIVEFITLKG